MASSVMDSYSPSRKGNIMIKAEDRADWERRLRGSN